MTKEIKTNKVTLRMKTKWLGEERTPIIALIDADYILIEEDHGMKMVHVYKKDSFADIALCAMSIFKEDGLIITYRNEEGEDIEVYGEE